jgi:hypothetical protein
MCYKKRFKHSLHTFAILADVASHALFPESLLHPVCWREFVRFGSSIGEDIYYDKADSYAFMWHNIAFMLMQA